MFGIYQGDLGPLYGLKNLLAYNDSAVAALMPDSHDDECAADICYECFCMEQVCEPSFWWKHQRECVKATTGTATAQLPAPWS